MKKGINKKLLAIIIIVLVVIETGIFFLMYKSFLNKDIISEKSNFNVNSNLFAILIEQEDGTYIEEDTWPNDDYEYDASSSGCIDADGNKIENSLTFDPKTQTVLIETEYTTYCYIYFNMITIDDKIFSYTGTYQDYTAATSGYYFIETYGASGGSIGNYAGGKGGYSSGYIYLEKNDKLYVYVGGQGVDGVSGYNGGGEGNITYGNAGGGATDIRYFKDYEPSVTELVHNSAIGYNSRIMVAGGGGGANLRGENYGEGSGGAGGSLIGGTGTSTNNSNAYGYGVGTGGTQNNGGSMYWVEKGSGERSTGYYNESYFGYSRDDQSGGGSGYYGGGSAGHGGAGGGSSYISGYAGVNSIDNADDVSNPRTHTNNTLHYSGKYFLNGRMESGVNEGNGMAIIKYVGKNYNKTNESLNNVRYIRDCIDGNSLYQSNEWVELQAISNGENVAYKKLTGDFNSYVTDGNVENSDEYITATSTEVYSSEIRTSFDVSSIKAGDVLYFQFEVYGIEVTGVEFNDIGPALNQTAEFSYFADPEGEGLHIVGDPTTYTVSGFLVVTDEMVTDRTFSYSTMRFIDIVGTSLTRATPIYIIKNPNYHIENMGTSCVKVDLGKTYDLDEIAVWHYYKDGRSYSNHYLYVSSDDSNWTTIINNKSGVIETNDGIRVKAR